MPTIEVNPAGLLAVRDALVDGDRAEAYHQLRMMADPEPIPGRDHWAAWEAAAKPGDDSPEFDMSDDGIISLAAGWTRDDVRTGLRLVMADVAATPDEIGGWSNEQCQSAEIWALSVTYYASDNDVQVPERPTFLPRRTAL